MRSLLFATLLLTACGDDPAGFVACGGDALGSWNFSGATVDMACSSGTPAIEGFLQLNANGRYSVNGKSKAWKLHFADACGFDTIHAGHFKQEGSRLCFADTPEQLAAQPCDESARTVDAPWSAAADYCVEGTTLTLSTRTFFGLSQAATLTLSR